MTRAILLRTALIVVSGSLLHFAWQWSGRSPVVALMAAVNESTWEHLKLAFWPAFILTLIRWPAWRRDPGFIVATAIRLILPSLLIVLLFYGYIWLVGHHALVADLVIFVVAIWIGEALGETARTMEPSELGNSVALILVLFSIAAFSVFTYYPPEGFLFVDPTG